MPNRKDYPEPLFVPCNFVTLVKSELLTCRQQNHLFYPLLQIAEPDLKVKIRIPEYMEILVIFPDCYPSPSVLIGKVRRAHCGIDTLPIFLKPCANLIKNGNAAIRHIFQTMWSTIEKVATSFSHYIHQFFNNFIQQFPIPVDFGVSPDVIQCHRSFSRLII